ncbi:MAG: hypothetical protein PHH26_00015 [Candidatus Thermoplasmatota archaeon]|nr:hypothetical protein [Candidatus Thermoplasmatota archaeon]
MLDFRTMRIREMAENDIAGVARVHVDCWRTTYAGIMPDDYLNGISYERSGNRWKKNLDEIKSKRESFCFVAENDGGEIIGFSYGGPQRNTNTDFFPEYKGEIYAAYVLKAQQQKGAGRPTCKSARNPAYGTRNGFYDCQRFSPESVAQVL